MTEPLISQSHQAEAWPRELRSFQATLYLSEKEGDLTQLSSALAAFLGPRTSPSGSFGFWVFIADPTMPTIARLSYNPRAADQMVQLQLLVDTAVQVPQGAERERFAKWDTVLAAMQPHLNEVGRKNQFYIGAAFEFPLTSWEPVAGIPVPITGLVPERAGNTLLTGFTLEFPDRREAIERLAITVYPSLKEINGRVYFHMPIEANSLASSVVKVAKSYQNLIARPVASEAVARSQNA
jgi:hypothetical protein